MKAVLFLSLFLLASISFAHAQSRFDTWDANKDGKLSRDEVPENARKNFDRVDRNSDGSISREEDQAAGRRDPQQAQPGGNRAPRLPDTVEVIEDVPYAGNDNPRQQLDLFLPKDREGKKLPLLVFIHGGGWRNGSKDGAGGRLAPFLANSEIAGASIGYRLTNEAQWPSQLHDCKAALRWLRGNADQYHLDPEKIVVWGTSAGGHLVAMLGVSQDVNGLEGDLGDFDGESSAVSGVINYFGPSELLTMDDHPGIMTHNAPDSPEAFLIGGPIQENQDKTRNASPLTHVSKDDAAFLIVHGTGDPLVPYAQSEKLDALLDEAGVKSTLIRVEGGGHGRGFPDEKLEVILRQFLEKHLQEGDANLRDDTIAASEAQPDPPARN